MSQEKTEQPTPKKLKDAREKGQVAQSKEVSGTALVLAIFGYIWFFWDSIYQPLVSLLSPPDSLYTAPFSTALDFYGGAVLEASATILLPVLGLTIVVGIFSNVLMIGVLFSFEKLMPKLENIDPVAGIKRLFSLKNLFEFLKSNVKVLFLGALLTLVILDGLRPMVQAPACGLDCVQLVLSDLLKVTLLYTALAFVVIAVIDYPFQLSQHIKELKMTKEEVKQEFKEMEGDPIIKGRRKQLHRELLSSNQQEGVKKAAVVVVNPVHFAVALKYEAEETPLPLVVAKGAEAEARRIVEIAKEAGVPVVQNIPLARALFHDVDVDFYIPRGLMRPTAEVLRYVQDLASNEAQSPPTWTTAVE